MSVREKKMFLMVHPFTQLYVYLLSYVNEAIFSDVTVVVTFRGQLFKASLA